MATPDPEGYYTFPTTHWSLVAQAGVPTGDVQRQALSRLLEQYLPALRSYLVHGRRVPADVAAEVLQGFLHDKVLEQELVSRADQARGRFRALLVVSLGNYYATWQRGERRRQRRVAATPEPGVGAADPTPDPAAAFDLAWARQVLDQAVEQMRADCVASARPDVWGVFEGRVLRPALDDASKVAYQELVDRFDFASPAQASNVLVTATRMFARVLRSVVGRYELGDADVDEEIRHLREALSRGGAGPR